MKEFVGLRAKTSSYLIDAVVNIKKQKEQRSAIKRKLKFEDYKNCLEATQLEHTINDLEKMKLM